MNLFLSFPKLIATNKHHLHVGNERIFKMISINSAVDLHLNSICFQECLMRFVGNGSKYFAKSASIQ